MKTTKVPNARQRDIAARMAAGDGDSYPQPDLFPVTPRNIGSIGKRILPASPPSGQRYAFHMAAYNYLIGTHRCLKYRSIHRPEIVAYRFETPIGELAVVLEGDKKKPWVTLKFPFIPVALAVFGAEVNKYDGMWDIGITKYTTAADAMARLKAKLEQAKSIKFTMNTVPD